MRHDRLVALPIPLEQAAKQEVRCGIERILLDREPHLEAGGKNQKGKDDSRPSRDEHFLHRVCHLLRGLRQLREIAPSLFM